jgi:osmotically-inducible protein OsmY
MARQDRWTNEERRWRDDDRRDWRQAGDDWRRGEGWRGRGWQGEGSSYGGGRDYFDSDTSDEVRRRDIMGYGGANRDMGRSEGWRDDWRGDRGLDDWRGDFGFARSEADSYASGRPGRGSYGGMSQRGMGQRRSDYEGRGSNFYDRDSDWGYGRGGRDDWSRGGEERGFFDRASDEVASWFGDRDAERRRREDQFRGRGPKGYTRSDDRIREDDSDRLTDDPFVDASDIEVIVTSAEVTLSGFVPSREQRRRAEDMAERISGVTHVQNNIRVRSQSETGSQSGTGARGQLGTQTGPGNLGETAFGRDTSTGEVSGRSGTGAGTGTSRSASRKTGM